MTIYEYITKNLPNLNRNILPQIFESEGVELTEDIEKYLRETPGNTNWNMLNNWGIKSEDKDKRISLLSIDFDQADSTGTDSFNMTKLMSYDINTIDENKKYITELSLNNGKIVKSSPIFPTKLDSEIKFWNEIEESPMEGIDPNYFLFIENDKVIIDFSCTAAIAEDPSAYVTSAHVEFYEA